MMHDDAAKTESYIATRRFLRDFPRWFEVVKACVTVACRTNGEFAGTWVLKEAKKSGFEWFPNLRPLVSEGILRKTDVTRGGRRAYYSMQDVEGVRQALMEVERELNEAATEALGNAIFRFTFGIVGDAWGGTEGRGLGSGIGLCWKETYLVLTAAHVVQETPYERLYFLLPSDTMHFWQSRIRIQQGQLEMRKRFLLERPKVLLADDDDLAAVILDGKPDQRGEDHFYVLDDSHVTPSKTTQVGFLGYPAATSLPVGMNFMATPYLSFGQTGDAPPGFDHELQISVSYPTDRSVDPHGLSGSGLWFCPLPQKKIWSPEIRLVGLVTHHAADFQALVGCKIERVIRFLTNKEQRMGVK